MASIKYSGLVNGIKGNIAGTTFQGGKASNVVKTKRPAGSKGKLTKADAGRVYNPRLVIAEVSGLWRNLSAEQRLTWSTNAVNWPAVNKFGEPYTPSGYQVFMKLNSQLNFSGVSRLSVCPMPVTVETQPAITYTYADYDVITMTLAAAVPTGYKMAVWATQKMTASRGVPESRFRLLGYINAGETTLSPLSSYWVDMFGSLTPHGVIHFKTQFIVLSTGQTGVPVYQDLEIEP